MKGVVDGLEAVERFIEARNSGNELLERKHRQEVAILFVKVYAIATNLPEELIVNGS